METQVGIERQSHSNSEIIEDMSVLVHDPGHTRGRKKQYLNSEILHWQMKALLGLVLKDKQVQRYIVFTSLEDIERMLMNQRFFLNQIDSLLTHV